MKLTALRITNVLGIRSADLTLDRPVLCVLGQNGAGKSSIAHALEIALLGDNPRVTLRKEMGALVHRGTKAGSIEIDVKGEKPYAVTITATGTVTDSHKDIEPHYALPYVLKPQLFAELEAKERRSLLFKLLGLDLTPDGIKARLLAKECDAEKVDAVAPMFRVGFEAAAKHATTKTAECRGAWKATTGENYGDKKALTWRAPCPTFTGEQAAELQSLDGSIASAEAELADAQKRLAIAEHEGQQRVRREAAATALRETAKSFAYHADLVVRAEKDVADIEARLLDAQQKSGQAPMPKPKLLPCPECSAALCQQADGTLAIYPTLPADPPYDPEAAARIPELQKALGLQRTVLARHVGNRDQADEAAKQLKALEDIADGGAKPADPGPIRQTVETLRTSIAAMTIKRGELLKIQSAMDAADAKTKQARQYHQDVEQWAAIATALSPDGIPAEILLDALGPINKRLAQSAADSRWPVVAIGADMGITYGGRPLNLCSESETWRVNAMIGKAISDLSGLRLLVLDRFDCLDTKGRVDAMYWLDAACLENEIETAIVLGTMDSLPVDLDTIRTVRIEAGRIVQEREAVAA